MRESANQLDPRAQRALAESEALAEQCLREIRTVSYLLHPPELDQLGLQSALTRYIDGFVQRSGIQIELDTACRYWPLATENGDGTFSHRTGISDQYSSSLRQQYSDNSSKP
jgi:signal transduction histidine kinase